MLERFRLALAIVRGRATIVQVGPHLGLTPKRNPPYGYIVCPSYDHLADFMRENIGEDTWSRTVHTYEGV